MGKRIYLIIFLLMAPNMILPITHLVPLEYSTIQAGMDASISGDSVLVSPGTYVENISFGGKSIAVSSRYLHDSDSSLIYSTIIDGSGSGVVVSFQNGEDSLSTLSGFTITNGYSSAGGGIKVGAGASPIIRDVLVSDNSALSGGGIHISGNSSPCFEGTEITNNSAFSAGGIYCSNSSLATFLRATISNNTGTFYGGGVYSISNSTVFLQSTLISGNVADNGGGGIYCDDSEIILFNVTMVQNSSDDIGSGIYSNNSSLINLTNTILWQNGLHGIHLEGATVSDSIKINYSNIQGGSDSISIGMSGNVEWGVGNINTDPMFCDFDAGDLTLWSSSPCVGSGLDSLNIGAESVGCIGPPFSGPVWYISPSGSDTNIGDIENPFASIQRGIESASTNDTVLISPGTYHENIDFLGKDIVVASHFLTTQDTTYIQSTIIDGDSITSVVTINGTINTNPRLSGLTIMNGYGTLVDRSSPGGGGIYIAGNTSPFVDHCIIRENSATGGAGVCVEGGASLSMSHCLVGDNHGFTYHSGSRHYPSDGGGIYVGGNQQSQTHLDLNDVTISSNSAYSGAGLNLYEATASLDDVRILNNTAARKGGGGNISEDSQVEILNSIISNNVVGTEEGEGGGGIYIHNSNASLESVEISNNVTHAEHGGGMYLEYECDVSLSNVEIKNNQAPHGHAGGLWVWYSDLIINHSEITENHARYRGGGIYSYDHSTNIIENSLISRNTADDGSAILAESSTDVFIVNSTIVDNNPEVGNINHNVLRVDRYSSLILINSIVWNEETRDISLGGDQNVSSYFVFTNSNIRNGIDGIGVGGEVVIDLYVANIDQDPLFVNPDSSDYHLQTTSPCIDAGTSQFVWDGDTLVNFPDSSYEGTAPDMGAFEFHQTVSITQNEVLPNDAKLYQNFPNPFNPITSIRYSIPNSSHVSLKIFDLKGREVDSLVDKHQQSGSYNISWSALDKYGNKISSGVYLARLETEGQSEVIKMVYLQ